MGPGRHPLSATTQKIIIIACPVQAEHSHHPHTHAPKNLGSPSGVHGPRREGIKLASLTLLEASIPRPLFPVWNIANVSLHLVLLNVSGMAPLYWRWEELLLISAFHFYMVRRLSGETTLAASCAY